MEPGSKNLFSSPGKTRKNRRASDQIDFLDSIQDRILGSLATCESVFVHFDLPFILWYTPSYVLRRHHLFLLLLSSFIDILFSSIHPPFFLISLFSSPPAILISSFRWDEERVSCDHFSLGSNIKVWLHLLHLTGFDLFGDSKESENVFSHFYPRQQTTTAVAASDVAAIQTSSNTSSSAPSSPHTNIRLIEQVLVWSSTVPTGDSHDGDGLWRHLFLR